MQFCWEDCEETDQQSRRNSIHTSTALFLFPCIFSCLREPGFVCCVLQGWISSFFQVPIQTSAVWGGSCKPPEFLFFCFWNSENSYFYSLFTSPIVSLWARRIRQCLSWLTAQYKQWREFSNSPKSKIFTILWSASRRIKRGKKSFKGLGYLNTIHFNGSLTSKLLRYTLTIAPYMHALLGSEIIKERK